MAVTASRPEEQPVCYKGEQPVSVHDLRDKGIVYLGPEVTKAGGPIYFGNPEEVTELLRRCGNGDKVEHRPLDTVTDHGFSDKEMQELAGLGGRFVFCRV